MAAPPPYDPAGYDPDDPLTWPQPIPPATLYQPGMVWTMTGPGIIDGQTFDTGDLLFVRHRPRLYGDDLYGDGMYGSTPDGNWSYRDVAFLAWYVALPPQDQPPFPYAGCPFADTGWWVIVEAFYFDAVGSRLYGDDAYGAGVYGDASSPTGLGRLYGDSSYGDGVYGDDSVSPPRWVDITAGYTQVNIDRGTRTGAPQVDALSIDVTWYDPDYRRVDTAQPAAFYLPPVGAPLRVSFYDPLWQWHPRAVGEIESITDPAIDQASGEPRFVTISAFGHVLDVGRTLAQWQRPAEASSTRFAALLDAAGWRWALDTLTYPPDVALHADPKPRDVKAREELDRTAISAGWTFDTDLRGRPRLRAWPLPLLDPPITIRDCPNPDDGEPTPAVVATLITFTADQSQLINVVTATNMEEPPKVATATDATSVAIYGGHDSSAGIGLAFANQADGDALVARVVARYGRIVTHVEPVTADTLVDPAWLPVLADVDVGAQFNVVRHHPALYRLASILTALSETITPARYTATLNTTTTTPTL